MGEIHFEEGTMRKRLSLVVCSLLVLVLLAGCTIEYRTAVEKDGSGQMSVAMGFTAQEAGDMAELSGGSATDLCQQMWAESSSEYPANAVTREEQRGDETYCVIEFTYANLQELRTDYETMGITVNRLEIVDERFYYDVSIDMGESESLGFAVNMTWIVTMPGSVGTHNATSVSGQTLTWNLVPGQVNSMRAESSLGSNWLWWVLGGLGCLCLLVVVIGAVVGVVLYLRKKKKS
jgi:hypothetical protein